MLGFDKTICKPMAPTPSKLSSLAFSAMLDGTLRLNGRLCEALRAAGADYVCIWVNPELKDRLSGKSNARPGIRLSHPKKRYTPLQSGHYRIKRVWHKAARPLSAV